MSKIIMGIELPQRMDEAPKFQSILTKYGCSISTRLGLHLASTDACSPSGLIILEFIDNAEADVQKLENELASLEDIKIQKMIF